MNCHVFLLFALLLLGLSLDHSVAQGPKFQTLEYDGEFEETDEFVESEITENTKPVTQQSDSTKQPSQYDDEEFVADDKATDKQEGAATQGAKTLPERTYYLELVYLLLLMVYGVNFLLGRRTNEEIAKAWGKQFSKLFEQNFSKLGEGALLTKESQNCFKLTATGRRNCIGLQATLELKKRHDLVSLLLGLFTAVEDTLTIEVPVETDSMAQFVFAVVQATNMKKYTEENQDISLYTTPAKAGGVLSEELVVLTDCSELVPIFLHSDVAATLNKYKQYFIGMHFTDQAKNNRYKNQLKFVFRMPAAHAMEDLKTLLRMVLHFIDLVARTKLSQQAKLRAEKKRAKAAEVAQKATHTQRQEAAQQRKLEKLKAEKKKLASLSEEQQRKIEQKEQKRALKKRYAGGKVRVLSGGL